MTTILATAPVRCADDETLFHLLAHLRGLGRAPNTLDAYRCDLADFLAFAAGQGTASVTDLAPAHTSAWLANQGIAASSRARKLNALHTFAR